MLFFRFVAHGSDWCKTPPPTPCPQLHPLTHLTKTTICGWLLTVFLVSVSFISIWECAACVFGATSLLKFGFQLWQISKQSLSVRFHLAMIFQFWSVSSGRGSSASVGLVPSLLVVSSVFGPPCHSMLMFILVIVQHCGSLDPVVRHSD